MTEAKGLPWPQRNAAAAAAAALHAGSSAVLTTSARHRRYLLDIRYWYSAASLCYCSSGIRTVIGILAADFQPLGTRIHRLANDY